jgi:hypothetical protein
VFLSDLAARDINTITHFPDTLSTSLPQLKRDIAKALFRASDTGSTPRVQTVEKVFRVVRVARHPTLAAYFPRPKARFSSRRSMS